MTNEETLDLIDAMYLEFKLNGVEVDKYLLRNVLRVNYDSIELELTEKMIPFVPSVIMQHEKRVTIRFNLEDLTDYFVEMMVPRHYNILFSVFTGLGPIPDDKINLFSKLDFISHLIFRNFIDRIAKAIVKMRNIERLTIGCPEEGFDLSFLKELPNLDYLSLNGTLFSVIPEYFTELKKLEDLSIDLSSIENQKLELINLINVTGPTLYFNEIRAIHIGEIAQLTNVESLRISINPWMVKKEELPPLDLRGMKNLKMLSLTGMAKELEVLADNEDIMRTIELNR